MNGRTAKGIRRKVRQEIRVQRNELLTKSLQSTYRQPFRARLRLAWHILIGR